MTDRQKDKKKTDEDGEASKSKSQDNKTTPSTSHPAAFLGPFTSEGSSGRITEGDGLEVGNNADDGHPESTLPVTVASKSLAPTDGWLKRTQDFPLTTLEPIHAVQHQILDLLIDEIPFTLMTVSRALYDRIARTLYTDIHLDKDTVKSTFRGLIIPARGSDDTYNLGRRKVEAFKATEEVYFLDSEAAEAFIALCIRYEEDVVENWKLERSPPIFPNLQHVHLGGKLVSQLATVYTNTRLSLWHAMMLPSLQQLPMVFNSYAPTPSICFDWPLNWERNEELFDAENDDDLFEPTLAYAVSDLLAALNKRAGLTTVCIHINVSGLSESWAAFGELVGLDITIEVIDEKGLTAAILYDSIFDHDLWVRDKAQTIKYAVPDKEDASQHLEDLAGFCPGLPGRITVLTDENCCRCRMWDLIRGDGGKQ